MYSLDVNFLKDRPEYRPQVGTEGQKKQRQVGATTPLLVGVLVGLLLPAAVGGLWFFLQQQNAQLTAEITDLDEEIKRQQIEQQKITNLNKQIQEVNGQTTALATVFNQIKPWSAMLQDIRERIPPGVQITNIQQTQVADTNQPAPSPSPAASPAASNTPPPAPKQITQLEISGTARSFDDVNYFLLTLQRSPFFQNDGTQLVNAELVRNSNRLEVKVPENRNQSGATVTYELPKIVQYKISTSLNETPATDLLRELDRKGAVGLVTRIRTLQQIQDKGATQR